MLWNGGKQESPLCNPPAGTHSPVSQIVSGMGSEGGEIATTSPLLALRVDVKKPFLRGRSLSP